MNLFSGENIYAEIVGGLRGLGYTNSLLVESYRFGDWFAKHTPTRQIAAAAFGQTPASYDTALIGVARSNGLQGAPLIDEMRSLGAPFVLEIDTDKVREWAVSGAKGKHELIATYRGNEIHRLWEDRREWKPETLLRAKNIGSFKWTQQLSLFAGLLPELEEHIQAELDPLLRSTLSATKTVYESSSGRPVDPSQLFKLVFWLLTAKVFHDRGIRGFELTSPDPDELLAAVARQHKMTEVPRLLNRHAREAAAELVWNKLDFRNLSVEVLSQIWASTLVDDETKNRLGIHRTSRTIVRYIMERIPFAQAGDDKRIILEPCCGSGVFLVGAMNALRPNLFGATPAERHDYFVKHLVGIEKDPFGAEISRLALTLADFPNPNDWKIADEDVFSGEALASHVRKAGVVLCNPPFGDFDDHERETYQFTSVKKPVELLLRVLDDLHPSGVIGFVLPRAVVDGKGYSQIRRRIAERFASIDLTVLPDRAFEADPEVALLVATEPIPHGKTSLGYGRVYDRKADWITFEHTHEVSFRHRTEITVDSALETLAVPELPEVWDFLVNYPQLADVAEIHRGIEWSEPLVIDRKETGNRKRLVRPHYFEGSVPGVAPQTKFRLFERPEVAYLEMRDEYQRGNAYNRPWDKPKAILNKSTKSRGRWRMAAFADRIGWTCYQTFIGVWPNATTIFDETLLSAVLNSVVANAFVSTREGKTDITMEVLSKIPMPHFTTEQSQELQKLVRRYESANPVADTSSLLMKIDATVLDGYRLPPRIERQLLDYFHGEPRPTPYKFAEYPTWGQGVYFSLSFYTSGRAKSATAESLRNRVSL